MGGFGFGSWPRNERKVLAWIIIRVKEVAITLIFYERAPGVTLKKQKGLAVKLTPCFIWCARRDSNS